MANEYKKDFNAMLRDSKDMPKVQIVTDPATIEKYGGTRMCFAPPLAYDALMKQVSAGKLTTVGALRAHLARQATTSRRGAARISAIMCRILRTRCNHFENAPLQNPVNPV